MVTDTGGVVVVVVELVELVELESGADVVGCGSV